MNLFLEVHPIFGPPVGTEASALNPSTRGVQAQVVQVELERRLAGSVPPLE